jgi:hypothetical protein
MKSEGDAQSQLFLVVPGFWAASNRFFYTNGPFLCSIRRVVHRHHIIAVHHIHRVWMAAVTNLQSALVGGARP